MIVSDRKWDADIFYFIIYLKSSYYLLKIQSSFFFQNVSKFSNNSPVRGVKNNMRGQTKHGLWNTNVKIKYLPGATRGELHRLSWLQKWKYCVR